MPDEIELDVEPSETVITETPEPVAPEVENGELWQAIEENQQAQTEAEVIQTAAEIQQSVTLEQILSRMETMEASLLSALNRPSSETVINVPPAETTTLPPAPEAAAVNLVPVKPASRRAKRLEKKASRKSR